MKIGVNARLLTKPFTGIGQYTYNLFKELPRIDDKNEYILIVPDRIDQDIEKNLPRNVRVEILHERKIGTAGMKKTWWEQIALPEYFVKNNVDIAFFTYPSNPWTRDWYKKGIKTIVTVHDCIPWMRKEYRKGLFSRMFHKQTKKAVKLADVIFTVSDSSKKDVVKVCEADEKKVFVVYNDANEVYKERLKEDYIENILEELNLKKNKFFLYVGGFDKRKNVRYLMEEYEKFVDQQSEKDAEVVPLVLVGGKIHDDKLYASFDKDFINKKGKLIRTGFLEDKKLAALYRGCKGFLHFSEHEGFNIPLIEAANCGAPLIISDIETHREVAGDKAYFVDNKKGSGSIALKKLMDEGFRDKMAEKSLELAKKYSWSSSAQKVKDVIFLK